MNEEKINYDKKLKEIINNLNVKPKLLLHSCCGPCSSYVITYLKDYFDITVLYYNPNIEPIEEYEKRKKEQIRLINELNLDNVRFMDADYNNLIYHEKVINHENDKEGGLRCHICYELRLVYTKEIGIKNNFDYFGTTLTVSPYKNAKVINELGANLESDKIKWLYSDFKKNDGYKKSIILSKEHNLYRQDYCGCLYSKNTDNLDY